MTGALAVEVRRGDHSALWEEGCRYPVSQAPFVAEGAHQGQTGDEPAGAGGWIGHVELCGDPFPSGDGLSDQYSVLFAGGERPASPRRWLAGPSQEFKDVWRSGVLMADEVRGVTEHGGGAAAQVLDVAQCREVGLRPQLCKFLWEVRDDIVLGKHGCQPSRGQ